MDSELGLFSWLFIIGTILFLVIGIAAIVKLSHVLRANVKRGDEKQELVISGVGILLLWATIELVLCGLYFWMFRARLDAQDIPKIVFTIIFIACAYAIPLLMKERSTLAFIPYTLHLFLLIFLFLRDETIEYPHGLNVIYTILALTYLVNFSVQGVFKSKGMYEKAKNGENRREKIVAKFSNFLLALSTAYLIIYVVDFARHWGRIPNFAFLYMIISVICAYLSAILLKKSFGQALIPVAISFAMYLYSYNAMNIHPIFPFHLNVYYGVIVVMILIYFMAIGFIEGGIQSNPPVLEKEVKTTVKSSKLEKELKALDEAIHLNPNLGENYIKRADIYLDLKHYTEAMSDATKAIELKTDVAVAYGQRAIAQHKVGKYEEALEDYNRAIQLDDDISFYYNRGRLYEEMQLVMHAIESFHTVVQRDKHYAEAAKHLHRLEFTPFVFDEKVTNYAMALTLAESTEEQARLYQEIGMFYRQFSMPDASIKNFEKELEIKPSDEGYFQVANTYIAQKAFDESMVAINRALELNKRVWKYYELRGVLHRVKNDFASALSDYNSAIALNPNFHAYLNRGITYAEMEQFPQALADIDKALELEPKNSDAKNARINVIKLQKGELSSPQEQFKIKPQGPAENQNPMSNTGPDGLPFRLPNVDNPPTTDLNQVFSDARRLASEQTERRIVAITPGRMMMLMPCPDKGSIPQKDLENFKQMFPTEKALNVTVIANNDLTYLAGGAKSAIAVIPFLGQLFGFGYTGHNVIIFEGHPNAFAIGCKNADMLLVDEAMIPLLQADWLDVLIRVMNSPQIIVFKRDGQLSHYIAGRFT